LKGITDLRGSGRDDGFPVLPSQQLRAGGSIPVHRHWEKGEAFHVLEGSGIFSLNDVSYPIEKGATIFIPKNAW
jgi:mannose-6-phosphate isomerase-like protein (cupin superfamily)